MRWFKHLSESSDDEKLADILTEFGPEGYGVWWLMIEAVARQMDNTDRCEAVYPVDIWARKLYVSKRKATNFLKVFSEKNLIFLKYDDSTTVGKIIVKIPNLLKFRDEYSKKSGQTPSKDTDTVSTKKQKQKQKQNKKEPVDVAFEKERLDFFSQAWAIYPRKIGKPDALRHYLRTVKTDDDINRVNRALGNYLENVKGTEMKYIKHGDAWFNTWQNWEPQDGN